MKLLAHHDHHHCGGHSVSRKRHGGRKHRSQSRSVSRARDRSHSRSRSRTRGRHHRRQRHARMDHFHGKCSKKRASSSSSSHSDSSSRSSTPPERSQGHRREPCRLRSHFRARNVYHWHPGHAKCSGCPSHKDKSSPSEKFQDLVDLTSEGCEQAQPEVQGDDLALGPEINEDLAKAWTEIARNGLSSDLKKYLLEKYKVSKNCPSLLGPALNSEVSAAAKESIIGRDEDQMTLQTQIGNGLSALGQVITTLNSSKGQEVSSIMDTLNEAAIIIIDAHHDLTKARRAVVSKKMSEQLGSIAKICQPRDEFLFGSDLKDKIRGKHLEKGKKKGFHGKRGEKCPKFYSDGETDQCRKCKN